MKQVTIKIKDLNNRLIAKEYFTSVSQFVYYATDYIENNLCDCYELEIKVGDQFKAYKLGAELLHEALNNKISLREQIVIF